MREYWDWINPEKYDEKENKNHNNRTIRESKVKEDAKNDVKYGFVNCICLPDGSITGNYLKEYWAL